ncbi:hypothetical protein B0H19DRAFT_1247987 [Mycena capillaripes]|nr:hypothetical protein B0H19DRAFT_1247987 [Mycena capillaripes]
MAQFDPVGLQGSELIDRGTYRHHSYSLTLIMESTNANLGMSFEEASAWVCPESDYLSALYPTLTSHEEQVQAWLADNRESVEEAVKVFMANEENFEDIPPEDVSRSPSGSLFTICTYAGYVPIYWDPPTIEHDHEGTMYIVTTPEHVAALHTIRDWPTALAYLQSHYDSRSAVPPLVFTVPDFWRPDVVIGERPKGKRKYLVRYTLYLWHKHQEFDRQPDWIACQHYFSEHYDLKEVLDPEGREVLSSELGEDCLDLARL